MVRRVAVFVQNLLIFAFYEGGHMKPDLYNWISSVAAEHGVEAAAEIAKFEARHVYAVKVHFTQDIAELQLIFHRSLLKRRKLTATILSQRQSMCS